MYFSLGLDTCIRNIVLAGAKHGEVAATLVDARQRYLDFCREVGGVGSVPNSDNEGIWVDDEGRINVLVRHFLADSMLTDRGAEIEHTPIEARNQAKSLIFGGIDYLGKNYPSLADLLALAIHSIFYQRSHNAGGGSISSAPGVIWCAARRDWAIEDCAEFLIHELTHNLLFVDERVNRHYKSLELIADRKHYAVSAVLRQHRPLDKVFHSLVVAIEILLFRRANGSLENPKTHPPTNIMIDAINACIDSIEKLPLSDLVDDRFMELFDVMKGWGHDRNSRAGTF